MRLPARRSRHQLESLQAVMRKRAAARNAALRILALSRGATTESAQREYWLEFSWLDQEYRDAVVELARFCLSNAWGDSARHQLGS
jgi:hypothetical protein